MNNTFKINLDEFSKVKAFMDYTTKCPCDVDVSSDGFNRNLVDGKSIMGVMAVWAGRPIDVKLNTDNEEIIENFIYNFQPYILGE
jgi:phosphotransferase system HPr-like phosphotransfer protein